MSFMAGAKGISPNQVNRETVSVYLNGSYVFQGTSKEL